MKRHILFLLAALLLVIAVPFGARAAAPDDCSQYSNPKYFFVGNQAWWTAVSPQRGTNFGHLHVDLCFPLSQTVRGTFPLDIRLTIHDNPGKLVSLVIQIGSDGSYVAAKKTFKPPLTCATTCSWWVHLDVNTSGFPNDGSQEVRIRPKVEEPDGNTLVGSTSYQVNLANGKPIKNYRPLSFIQGKSWYSSGVQYMQARLTAGFPYNGEVHGNWTVAFACDSSTIPVSLCTATIDPDFHQMPTNNGRVLLQRAGPYSGNLTIDTTQLSDGPHRLVIKTDGRAPVPNDSTASGLLVIYFSVGNEGATHEHE